MKIKVLLYGVCFICSLTGIQQVSADERDIGGTVKFFLSGGLLSPSFQTIDYKDKDANDPSTSGSGIVLDINPGRGNHAIAIDYYAFTETYSEPETEFLFGIDTKEEFTALLLGYRYHFNGGFYIGGGILSLSGPTITNTVVRNEFGNFEIIGKFESVQPLALTLGYDHVFASGFTLGAHLLRSASVDSEIDSISFGGISFDATGADLEDIVIQSVGLGIGYSW